MKYTVLLLYPDYMAETFGQETYCSAVEASSPEQAVQEARMEVEEEHAELQDPNDMFCLAVFAGDHQDIKPAV